MGCLNYKSANTANFHSIHGMRCATRAERAFSDKLVFMVNYRGIAATAYAHLRFFLSKCSSLVVDGRSLCQVSVLPWPRFFFDNTLPTSSYGRFNYFRDPHSAPKSCKTLNSNGIGNMAQASPRFRDI